MLMSTPIRSLLIEVKDQAEMKGKERVTFAGFGGVFCHFYYLLLFLSLGEGGSIFLSLSPPF